MSHRAHSLLLLALPVLVGLAACDFDDSIGGDASATAGETGETGETGESGETGETESTSSTGGTDGTDGTGTDGTGTDGTGESGDSGGVECPIEELPLGYSDPDPSGYTAKELFSHLVGGKAGVLTYQGGGSSPLHVEAFYDGGYIRALHTTGQADGCGDQSVLYVDAMLSFASDDGVFQESLPVTLTRFSGAADGEIEFAAIDVDVGDLHGLYTPPATLDGHPLADFKSMELSIHGNFGGPRPMSGPLDLDLGVVHGAIYGQGELTEWSCSDAPGEPCMGAFRDYVVGSFLFGG